MTIVGEINSEHFNGIASVMTNAVVMTEKQIQHIKERHPKDYERFSAYIPQILSEPDYILEANKPDSAIFLRRFKIDNERFQLILRLKTAADPADYVNSVITFFKIREKEWNRLLNNKNILYKDG